MGTDVGLRLVQPRQMGHDGAGRWSGVPSARIPTNCSTISSIPSTAEKATTSSATSTRTTTRWSTAQRQETDPEKRKALVFKAQEMLARDQPIINLVYPTAVLRLQQEDLGRGSVVDQSRHRHQELLDLHRRSSRSARRRTSSSTPATMSLRSTRSTSRAASTAGSTSSSGTAFFGSAPTACRKPGRRKATSGRTQRRST